MQLTDEDRDAIAYLIQWEQAGKKLNMSTLLKLQEIMQEALVNPGKNKLGQVISFASYRDEDTMNYTRSSLTVINKVIELVEALEQRNKAASVAQDKAWQALMMWEMMNRKNDDN